MNRYIYTINEEKTTKKVFLDKLAEAFSKNEKVSDFISISVPDHKTAENKIRQMQNTAKKSLFKKSQTFIIKNTSFRIIQN